VGDAGNVKLSSVGVFESWVVELFFFGVVGGEVVMLLSWLKGLDIREERKVASELV